MDPRPNYVLIKRFTSKEKLESLCFPGTCYTGHLVLQVGDIIRLGGANVRKDVIITELVPGRIGVTAGIRIAVPPPGFSYSEPHLQADVIVPSPGRSLNGPIMIMEAIISVDAYMGSLKASWENFTIVRGGQVVGNLLDIRQAYQWGLNEHRFNSQLRFCASNNRRIAQAMKQSGFAFINQSSLYRKVLASDLLRNNADLMIDLGPALDAELASLAEPGYVIVMYDNRIMGHDGYPVPQSATERDAYQHGPACFPTQVLQDIASLFGYTYGHAHLGPDGLGWNSFPHGSPMTGNELALVSSFHRDKVQRQIRHYPYPVTYNNKWRSQQYCIKRQLVTGDFWDFQNWDVDNGQPTTPVYHQRTSNVAVAPTPQAYRSSAPSPESPLIPSPVMNDPPVADGAIEASLLDPALFL